MRSRLLSLPPPLLMLLHQQQRRRHTERPTSGVLRPLDTSPLAPLHWLLLSGCIATASLAAVTAAAAEPPSVDLCAIRPDTFPSSCECTTSAAVIADATDVPETSIFVAQLACANSEPFALQQLQLQSTATRGLLVRGAVLSALNESALSSLAAAIGGGGGSGSGDTSAAAASLARLSLPGNGLLRIDLGAFDPVVASLIYLDLSDNALETDDVDRLPAFTRLGALLLGGNELRTFPTSVFSMRALAALDLSSNKLTAAAVAPPNGLAGNVGGGRWPLLRLLNLSDNYINALPLAALLGSAPALLTLDASHNEIDSVAVGGDATSASAVAGAVRDSPLQTLQLRGNRLSALDFLRPDAFPARLVSLGLAYNRLRSISSASFAFLGRLTELDVRGNALTSLDAGFQPPPTTSLAPVSLLLADNAFECDCSLAWMRTSSWPAARTVFCSAPPQFASVYTLANFPTVGCSPEAGAAIGGGGGSGGSDGSKASGAVVAVAVLGVVCAVAAVGYVALRHGQAQRLATGAGSAGGGGELAVEAAPTGVPVDAFGDSAEHIAGKELLLPPAASPAAHRHRGAHPRPAATAIRGEADDTGADGGGGGGGKRNAQFVRDLLRALGTLPIGNDGQCLLAAARAADAEQRAAAAAESGGPPPPPPDLGCIGGRFTNELAAPYLRSVESNQEAPYFSGPMEEYPFAPSMSRIPSAMLGVDEGEAAQGAPRGRIAILTGAAAMAGPSERHLPARLLEGYTLNVQQRPRRVTLDVPTVTLPLITYQDITAPRDLLEPSTAAAEAEVADGAVVCSLQVPTHPARSGGPKAAAAKRVA